MKGEETNVDCLIPMKAENHWIYCDKTLGRLHSIIDLCCLHLMSRVLI